MVSNTINIQLPKLLETIASMRAELSDDPEYQELKASLPEDWPL